MVVDFGLIFGYNINEVFIASDNGFVTYFIEQTGVLSKDIVVKKMFGDCLVYYKNIPVALLCDNVAYVRCLSILKEQFDEQAKTGLPYNGASLHYVVDTDDACLLQDIIVRVYKYRLENKK